MTAGRHDTRLLEAAREAGTRRRSKACSSCAARICAATPPSTCLTTSDAEDAVQEALLIVYQRVSALRSVGTFTQWIFQIIRRECLRLMRPGHLVLEVFQEEQYLSTHSDVDLRLDITMAVQSLPPLYRDIIILRDFEELTIREIAERLCVVSETVKTRLYRGRQLVREHLLA